MGDFYVLCKLLAVPGAFLTINTTNKPSIKPKILKNQRLTRQPKLEMNIANGPWPNIAPIIAISIVNPEIRANLFEGNQFPARVRAAKKPTLDPTPINILEISRLEKL